MHGKELSMGMIKRLYSRHYMMKVLRVSPADQGHAGIARDRIYVVLALKGRVEEAHNVQDVYAKVSKFISDRVQTVPSDYLISDFNELRKEAQSMAAKRKIKYSVEKARSTWKGKRFSMKKLLNHREAQGVREDKQKVLDAASSQYTRRVKPLEATAWGPAEVSRYMRWQLDQHKQGKLKKSSVGGFAWKLPKKSEDGEPADLPPEVISWEKKRKSANISPDQDQESDDDESKEAEPGSEEEVEDYGPTKRDKNWYLMQVETGKRVQLVDSGPFTLYVHEGQTCIISATDDEGSYCVDHFPQKKPKNEAPPKPTAEKAEREPNVKAPTRTTPTVKPRPKSESRGSTRAKSLKGMKKEGGGGPN
eukprot:s1084_g11.t1